MCVIINLGPNQKIPYDKFENATFNNPHGYGIVLKKDSRIQVIRECPKEGNDPEKIFKILEEHKDLERYVHLRWATVGDVSIDNTQPFDVLSSKKGDIVFMHNGTLHKYKPLGSNIRQQQQTLLNDPRSDTRSFVEEFLTPFMANWKGDINDPIFKKIISSEWDTSSKGLIISSSEEPLALGTWVEIDDEDGGKIRVSNNTYFDHVTRGPEKTRRDIEARKKEEEEKKKNFSDLQNVFDEKKDESERKESSGKGITFNIPHHLQASKLVEIPEFFSEEGIQLLGALTLEEIEDLYRSKEDMITTFTFLVETYIDVYGKMEKAVDKKQKAEKMIEELKKAKES